MHRLAFVLPLVFALLATGAHAQTVGEDTVKALWCAETFTIVFNNERPTIDPANRDIFDAFVAANAKLLDSGTQGYLDAGYTEEQVTKIKADLVTEVSKIIFNQQAGRFKPTDCNPLLEKFLVMPPLVSSSAAGEASAAPSGPAPSDASSSAP